MIQQDEFNLYIFMKSFIIYINSFSAAYRGQKYYSGCSGVAHKEPIANVHEKQ
jgi:hypothetical protein